MAEGQQVAARENAPAQTKAHEDELVLRPAVDIFENGDGITLQADLPGVAKERLNVQADRNSLLIEGEAVIDMPSGMEAIYADVQSTRYARSFVLSSELDSDRIEASLKDGVLTLRIPKRHEFRPRRIEVSAA
ncbi:MAG: Hsp20/alpha crystallin family protein [Betaproteobacteria bacterium]